MNRKFALIATAAALATSSAFAFQTAEDPAPISSDAFVGAPVSGEQVAAERNQYLQQLHSQPARAEDSRFVASDNAQPLTRAQVQANLESWEHQQAALPARAENRAPTL